MVKFISQTDQTILSELAKKYEELALLDSNDRKREAWRSMNDLHPIRPLYLFETNTVLGFVSTMDLHCTGAEARNVERRLMQDIRHIATIDDDKVLEPTFWVECPIMDDGFGVDLKAVHAQNSIGYIYNHPIDSLDKIDLLRPRTFSADHQSAKALVDELREIFPQSISIDARGPCCHLPQISANIYRLIGMDRFYEWMIDEPTQIARIAEYLADTYLEFLDWLEKENLIFINNSNDLIGSGSYGYVSELSRSLDPGQKATSLSTWGWLESQETASIDPGRFRELILPAMSKVAERFGLVYYGCCEQLHDRFADIEAAIPNIRSVSVSPWSNQSIMAEFLSNRYVFSRKMPPQFISGLSCDLAELSADVDETLRINARGCTEFIYRDVYDVGNDFKRLSDFGRMMRAKIGN